MTYLLTHLILWVLSEHMKFLRQREEINNFNNQYYTESGPCRGQEFFITYGVFFHESVK